MARSNRYAIRDRILTLDPKTDHQEIVYLVGSFEFPYLTRKSLEFALFRTYAVPSISKLLDETGEFYKRGQRRYDDTSLIISEIAENGYDSERGRTAIRRMNRLHARFDISNDDFLYVLSTFLYEPIRWNARFAWRKSTEVERQASYYFWYEVGRRMNIKAIPDSYETFEQFNVDYEREHFRYVDSNQRVGEATIQVFLKWYALPLRPMVRQGIYALLDEPLRIAFGFPKASRALTKAIEFGLSTRAGFIRELLSPRSKAYSFTKVPNRTYTSGYQIEALGPPDVPPDRVVDSSDESGV